MESSKLNKTIDYIEKGVRNSLFQTAKKSFSENDESIIHRYIKKPIKSINNDNQLLGISIKANRDCKGPHSSRDSLAQNVWHKDFSECYKIEDHPDGKIGFFATQESHQKWESDLQIIHYSLADQDQQIKAETHFLGTFEMSSDLHPECDELSIFDSAWAILKREPR